MKINFLKFASKKAMPDLWRGRCKYFSPSSNTVRWSEKSPWNLLTNPVHFYLHYTEFMFVTASRWPRPLSTQYHRNLFKKPAIPAWSNFTSFQADSSSHFSKRTFMQTRTWMEVLKRSWNNAATVPPPHLRLSLTSLAADSQWKSNSKIISAFWVPNNLPHLKVSNL